MNVLFVQMAKRYYRPHSRPMGGAPEGGWAHDILAELGHRGHGTVLATMDSPSAMAAEDVLEERPDGLVTRVRTSSPQALRPYVERADAVVLRKDHPVHREIFRGVRLKGRQVATILTTVGNGRIRFRPRASSFTVFVNGPEELRSYRRWRVDAEIFLKPAAKLFYEHPSVPVEKDYDIVQVVQNTDRERKRFPLLLEALADLDTRPGPALRVAVVGNVSSHDEQIGALNARSRRVWVTALGHVPHETVRDTLLRARMSVVTSRRDANPRVIAESLACDVPVACPADLTGGGFQIGPRTGEFFAPEARSLADTVARMLAEEGKYDPRRHCITLDQAADQLQSVLLR